MRSSIASGARVSMDIGNNVTLDLQVHEDGCNFQLTVCYVSLQILVTVGSSAPHDIKDPVRLGPQPGDGGGSDPRVLIRIYALLSLGYGRKRDVGPLARATRSRLQLQRASLT